MENDVKAIAKASIPVPFAKVTPQKPVNSGFTLCKIYVHGCGKNRNYSYMSEDRTKEALPTLSYVPVVGHLIRKYDKNGDPDGYYFGSHDYDFDENDNFKSVTVPFGVVIDDSFDFEDVVEFGKTVRYLTCNAYLWTGRWPELKEAIYSDDVWFNQSMEVEDIQYRPLEEDSNYSEFLSWRYSALCILGKSDDPEYHTEPCFINSKIEPVKFDLKASEFSQMMGELKNELALCFENETNQKGGNHLNQEEKDAIFAKFSVNENDVDFEITDNMTEEQLTEKLQEYCDTHKAIEGAQDDETDVQPDDGQEEPETQVPETDPVDTEKSEENASFSMTYQNRYKELDELCSTLNYVECNEDGICEKEKYCWLNDFDDEYVYYTENIWADGSRSTAKKRCAYELKEGVKPQFTGTPEEVFEKWLTAAEIEMVEADRAKLDELIRFKADTEKQIRDNAIADLFNQFEDVSETEEYANLREAVKIDTNVNIETVETQLFALRGKQVKFEKKPQNQTNIQVGIDMEDRPTDDGYGGLVQRAKDRRRF